MNVHASMVQAILWQVVDSKLQNIRKQFAAELDAFWDARNIYQAQLEAHQVLLHAFQHCQAPGMCYSIGLDHS